MPVRNPRISSILRTGTSSIRSPYCTTLKSLTGGDSEGLAHGLGDDDLELRRDLHLFHSARHRSGKSDTNLARLRTGTRRIPRDTCPLPHARRTDARYDAAHLPSVHIDESRHARAPQAYSGRDRGLYPRHRGRGAVRVEGARDRAGDERLGHRHPLACVARERACCEEALRRVRTGPSDRDEAGVDRDALQHRDPPRSGDRAPGTVARGGMDPAAMPQRGPGRDGRRHWRQPRHRDARRAQRIPRPVRRGVQGRDL